MKTKIRRFGKRSLSILLTLLMLISTMLVGMVTANAGNVSGGHVYFELPSNWTSTNVVQLGLYQNSYLHLKTMTKIEGTNLYYVEPDNRSNWNDEQTMFISNSDAWNPGNMDGTGSQFYTDKVTKSMSGGKFYLFTPTSTTADGKNVPISVSGGTNDRNNNLGRDLTVNIYTDGTSSSTGGSVSITGNYWKDDNKSIGFSTAASNGATKVNYDNCVYSSTATLTAKPINDYVFDGWYTSADFSGSPVSNEPTYSYTVKGDTTLYANFVPDKTQLPTPTLSATELTLNATNTSGAISVTNASEYTNYSVNYKFVVYKPDGTVLGDMTDNSYSFTRDDTNDVGAYTVKAVSTNTSDYTDSEAASFTLSKEYSVTCADVTNATVTPSSSSVAAGNTVTITVSPANAFKCTGITVNPTATVTDNNNGTYSFEMPAADVEVTATIEESSQCSITVSSNDDSMGTATTSAAQVYEGNTVTLTDKPASASYAFSAWTIDGSYTISSGSLNTNELTIIPTSNITATATFVEDQSTIANNLHFLYGTSHNPASWTGCLDVYVTSSGEHYVHFDLSTFNCNTTYYGGISLTKSYKNLCWSDKKESEVSPHISSDNKSLAIANYANFGINENDVHIEYKFVEFRYTSDSLASLSMKVGTIGPQYIIQPVEDTTSARIYAKNGTQGGSASYGTTTITGGATLSSTSQEYTLYRGTVGTPVTVTTTLNDDYKDTHFVYAFVVNGKAYPAASTVGNAYYTEVPIEAAGNYEITPIYYLNSCKDGSSDYITFYVDAANIGSGWGSTIATYAYYYTGSTTEATEALKADGAYPGQPMIYDEGSGRYYSRVPKTMTNTDGTALNVSGITINNYYNDSVHQIVDKDVKVNKQSYDFNNFRILAENDYDIIVFNTKYENSYDNKVNTADEVSTTISIDNYTNGWEYLTDNDGNRVSAIGNYVDTASDKMLYVVSTADHDDITGKTDPNAIRNATGQWHTRWLVFDERGNFITSGVASDFIPRDLTIEGASNTTAFNAIESYQNGAYKNVATKITFEKERTFESTTRLDGVWYYAKSDTSVSACAYYRTSENTNPDAATYSSLSQDASTASVNNAVSYQADTHGQTISVSAKSISGYVFAGWSVGVGEYNEETKQFESYRTLDFTSPSFTTTLDAEIHYVANYVKAAQGTVTISHSKYTGTDAREGLGYYLVEAYIEHANGSTEPVVSGSGSGANGQSIKLENVGETDKIVVTIKTTTVGENTFRYWYTDSSYGYEVIEGDSTSMTYNGESTDVVTGKSGTVTYTFTTYGNKIFQDNTQVLTSFNYYSDIAPVSRDYKLTYIYNDRFGNEKQYVVTDTHNDAYYQENGSWAPSEKLITDNAPAVEDLYKDVKWTIVKSNIDGTNATLEADYVKRTFTVYISESALGTTSPYEVEFNTILKKDDGGYFTCEDENFLYWKVTETDTGKEVTRQYQKEFSLRIVDDYTVTPVIGPAEDNPAFIGNPEFTREQYTDDNGDNAKDYVYADFLVSFNKGDVLLKDDTTWAKGTTYDSGLVIEISEGTTITADNYESNSSFNSISATVEEFIKGNSTSSSYTLETDTLKLYKFDITESKYTNMNRIQYYVRFNNKNELYTTHAMKAYYYVIETDVSGNKTVYVSDVTFNLYEISNSTSDTVTTTITT